MSEFEAETPAEERCRVIVERTDAEIARLTRERDEARAAWKLAVERPTKEELRSAIARAETAEAERDEALISKGVAITERIHAENRRETAEARCRELEGARDDAVDRAVAGLHRRIGDLGDSEDLTGCDGNEMLEAALTVCANFVENLKHDRALLSPPPPHTCQIHRATSGASDCGLEPCEEAAVHRDRGASRPAETATPEAAKCATCGGIERVAETIPGAGMQPIVRCCRICCAHHGPDCRGCGGAK